MNLDELVELAQKYDGTVSFDTEAVPNKMVASVSYKDADDKVVTVTRTLNLDGTSDLDQSDFDTEHEGEEIKTVDPVLAYVEEQLVAHNAKLNHEVKFDPKEEQHGHLGGAIEMAKDFYKYEPNEIRVFSTTNGLFVTDIDGNNIDKPRVLATDEAYDEVEGLDLDFEGINDDTFKEMDDEGDLVHYPSSFEEFLAFFALDKQEDDAMNTKNMRDALRQMYGGEAKVVDFLVLARSTAYEYTTVPTTILNPALDLFIKGLDSLFYSNGDFGSVAKARIEYSTGGEDDLDFMSLLRNMDLASKVMNPYRELLDNLLFLSMGNAFGKEGVLTLPKENVVAVEFTQQPTKETAEEAREKAIVKAYKENETLDVIKTCYNLDSNGALYSILRKHHVEPRDKKQATRGVAKRVAHITSDPDKMSAVLKAYRDGVTLTEIYKKFELHKNGLYYLLDLNNVPRRMKR